MEWTEKAITLLKQYWSQGWPTIDIAEKLGTTRNSVIGKIDRLKRIGEVEGRFSGGEETAIAKRIKKKIKGDKEVKKSTFVPRIDLVSKPVPPTPIPETPVSSTFLGITFEELEPWQCRYPHGGTRGTPITFCGQRRRPNSSYCDHCHQVCWVPLRKRS